MRAGYAAINDSGQEDAVRVQVAIHRRSLSIVRVWTVGISLLVTLGIVGVTYWTVMRARRTAVDQIVASAETARDVAAANVMQLFQMLDMPLRGAQLAMQGQDYSRAQHELDHSLLFDRTTLASAFGAVYIIDAKGDAVYDMRDTDKVPVNRESLPFFLRHKAEPGIGLLIDPPFPLQDGRYGIALSRRLDTQDGQFNGLVVGTIRMDYLLTLLGQYNIKGGTLALIRSDGPLIARYPYRPEDIGLDFNKFPVMKTYRSSPKGNFIAVAEADGIERFVAYREITGFPLILRVAMNGQQTLDSWRSQTITTISMVGGLLLAQLLLTLVLLREIGRRETAENSYRQLAEELNSLAHLDKLTSLPNRRKFDHDFDVEWRRMMRNRSCLSLLMIDIDHFKGYNDTYGHQAGDVALQAVARCIASAIRRPGDLAARYGGEEFAVILPDTPRDGANVVALGIHAALAAANIVSSASANGRLTVSIGISTAMHGPEAGSISCLEAADAALYEAKEQGRNRIVVSQAQVALT